VPIGGSKQEEYVWCMWLVGGRREICTEFWWGNLSVRPGRRWKVDIKIYAGVIGLEHFDCIDLAQDNGVEGCIELHSGRLSFLKYGLFLDLLVTYELLKKNSFSWSVYL
jgi:hypothetical protein